MSKPKRGDIVIYNDKAYYFQPNGTSCFLYEREMSIGLIHTAKHVISRKLVKLAPPGTVVIYNAPSRDPDNYSPSLDDLIKLSKMLHNETWSSNSDD